MAKGLYHCSMCKKHFYDHEATAMHIKDAHGGKGEVLRHPTKRELLVRDEAQRARIKALEEENDRLRADCQEAVSTLRDVLAGNPVRNADEIISRAALSENEGKDG